MAYGRGGHRASSSTVRSPAAVLPPGQQQLLHLIAWRCEHVARSVHCVRCVAFGCATPRRPQGLCVPCSYAGPCRYEALERERVAAEAMEAKAVLERRRLQRRHTDAFMRAPPAGSHALVRHRGTRPASCRPRGTCTTTTAAPTARAQSAGGAQLSKQVPLARRRGFRVCAVAAQAEQSRVWSGGAGA